ncbi:MAG TPA: bifunctional diaminohydroxyphosphoribosylaminopyrimidine deaminase/5-amino-6-(5-phosphoribosylamino)uracil reductase RibD [Verrucomicrobiales bacterium]|nr:bifunctional diaminohydroxyphosphoribosylaminopyrimidine deaminase/5-amino-6-(5-phosphoribosylamino)uracil reductase RibD [Verrucomicrobiales bacterium]
MERALELARKGFGFTSPNPCVGAVLVRSGKIIGEGWHRRAGKEHAEVEALRDCRKRGSSPRGATLYVTLEPCSTHGRTPPCTDAILTAGIRRVVVGATDPNPRHAGAGLRLLRRHGVQVTTGVARAAATVLNEGFNHWIVHRTPFVTLKAAMTLDGKIATAGGDSQWITGPNARRHAMRRLRRGADAILTGVNTILADDPSLTYRGPGARNKSWRRIILDSHARTPTAARVLTDANRAQTLLVVTSAAPAAAVAALRRQATVVEAPADDGRVQLPWLLAQLGGEGITHLLVEGGSEVNGAFLAAGLVQRIAFYFAPKVLGGRGSRTGVGGPDPATLASAWSVRSPEHVALGDDWFITGLVQRPSDKFST